MRNPAEHRAHKSLLLNGIIIVVPLSLFCTEPCRNGSLPFQTRTEVKLIKQYFSSVALVPQGLAASHVAGLGLFGGARCGFCSVPRPRCAELPSMDRGWMPEGDIVLMLLLPARSSSAQQPLVPREPLTPAWTGSWPTARCKVLRGK